MNEVQVTMKRKVQKLKQALGNLKHHRAKITQQDWKIMIKGDF